MNTREYLETREYLSRAKEHFDEIVFQGRILTTTERQARCHDWEAFNHLYRPLAQRLRAYEDQQEVLALRLSLKRGKKSA